MKPVQIFPFSVGIILVGTAIAKFLSACGNQPILRNLDPILGISFRSLLLVAALIEALVAFMCFRCKRITLQIGLVAWLATNLVIYRIGLLWVGYHARCPCLGNLTDAVHVPPQMADNIMKSVLAYLLVGSYGILIHLWWKNRKSEAGGAELEGRNLQIGADR